MVLGALILAGVLSLQLHTNDAGAQSKRTVGRRPVVLIYEINPWLQVIGSDSPSFALYEDGLLIFARPRAEGGGYEYASAKLSAQERDALVQSLPAKQFQELEPRYETTLATDQPTTVIKLWDRDLVKSVSVYGGLKRTDNDRKEGAPAAFVETYEKLKGFQPSKATRWTPEKVELMIWPFENAGDALPWPKNWPDTQHPETKRRGQSPDQISYSIYVTPAQYESLKKSAKEKSADALLINGRKWAFSFRFPFPAEESWRKK